MDGIKVSVVMPVLNGMPYFKEALDSVRNQTLKEMEIIVVDAGSTDGTCEYVVECSSVDSRIILFHSDRKSLGVQYNIGISKASGQYIGFCEGDDYIEPNMMEELYNTAKENDMPETIKSDFYLFFRKNGEEYNLSYHILPRYKSAYLGKPISMEKNGDIFLRDIYMWYGIYRRDFLKDNGIKLNETPGAAFQDGGFVQQVNMLADRQIYLPKQFYHYRRDNVNSSVYKKETSQFSLWEGKYVLDWLNKHQELKNRYIGMVLERMVGQFFVWLYIADIYHYGEISYQKELQDYRDALLRTIDDMSYPEKIRVVNNHLVFLLLYDLEGLNAWAKIDGTIGHERLIGFRDYICERKQVVIFTAGEIGQSVCAFLLKNNWEGEMVFCDNNEGIQGKKVMGLEVYSPANAIEKYPKAVYIVNPVFFNELYFDLTAKGISPDHILLPPVTDIYGGTGIDWKQ